MRLLCLLLLSGVIACGSTDRRIGRDIGTADGGDAAMDEAVDTALPDIAVDTTCASVDVQAEVGNAPVDIVFVVDNSTSMEPAIMNVQRGLNDFADRVASSGLDFRVIMLSLRRGEGSDDRFPICIPPPLAGNNNCGNGERFFHVSADIRSTQPVEQILGTLAQSAGYSDGEQRGSEPWLELLRTDATKTLVVVTDDNSRTCDLPSSRCSGGEPALTPLSLENFPGGGNPFNGNELGPGLLTSSYGPLFEGYTFNAIYGWGDEANPEETCTFPGGDSPPSPGPTYTALVQRTGGVRAQICDQADSSAWDRFLEAIANRVEETARLSCAIELPAPPDGMLLDPTKVNVVVSAEGASETLRKVNDADACSALGGWHYDNDDAPTEVILCPASCDDAQALLRESGAARIDLAFGCDTLLI
ncbi:MAG: hypothetical protein AAF411_01965 [Myxococcota bacterium]